MEHFGDILRKYRTDKRIGLRQFAKMLKKSAAYISRVEHGRDNPPSSELLEEMEGILDLPPSTLAAEAKKVPVDFLDAFTKNDINKEMLPRFMRLVKSGKLKRADWEKIMQETEKSTNRK